MLFDCNPMKVAHLSQTLPNMISIKEVCDTLGKTFLTSLVGYHWATGGLQVNSTPDYNLSFVPDQGEYIPFQIGHFSYNSSGIPEFPNCKSSWGRLDGKPKMGQYGTVHALQEDQ